MRARFLRWARSTRLGGLLLTRRKPNGLDPPDQLFALFATNGLLFLFAWLVLSYGYRHSHALPTAFKVSELIIVIGSVFASFFDVLAIRARNIGRGRRGSGTIIGLPESLLKTLVFIFSVLTCIALWQLVKHTGKAVSSPFAPLLTGPAVFGPFFAREWQTIAILVLTSVLLVWLVEGTSGDGIAHAWVYSGVATLIVGFAGILSVVRAGISPTSLSSSAP